MDGAFGRFVEPSLHVLVALEAGPRDGIGILTAVERLLGVPIGAGTLYGALARLESTGLIVADPDGGRRRAYRLSDAGRAEVQTRRPALDRARASRLLAIEGGIR